MSQTVNTCGIYLYIHVCKGLCFLSPLLSVCHARQQLSTGIDDSKNSGPPRCRGNALIYKSGADPEIVNVRSGVEVKLLDNLLHDNSREIDCLII